MKLPHFRYLTEKYLKSQKCKRIILMTQAAKNDFDIYFTNRLIREKSEVVYPCFKPKEHKKKKRTNNILFVGKNFYQKGGLEALNAFNKLEKNMDCSLTMISEFPTEIKRKCENNTNINCIDFVPGAPSQFMEKHFQKADLLLYPTHFDSFGSILIESMAHGVPIVSVKHYAIPEIIEGAGEVVDTPYNIHEDFRRYITADVTKIINPLPEKYTKSLTASCESILSDSKKYKNYAKTGYNQIKSGKFSINQRTKNMKRIYTTAIKEK
jgi:glycosyltransferase involved in cell wall biosynthesis